MEKKEGRENSKRKICVKDRTLPAHYHIRPTFGFLAQILSLSDFDLIDTCVSEFIHTKLPFGWRMIINACLPCGTSCWRTA